MPVKIPRVLTPDSLTPLGCFKALLPTIDQLSHLVRTAPLEDPKEMSAFSMMVAAHFMGAACGAMVQANPELRGTPLPDLVIEAAKLIAEMGRQSEAGNLN